MKNVKLQSFLKLVTKAKAVVLINDQVNELISFNGHMSIEKIQRYLEKKEQQAFFEHLENLSQIIGDQSNYLFCLKIKLNEIRSVFIEKDGLPNHSKLDLRDNNNLNIPFHDLNDLVRKKNRTYIETQRKYFDGFYAKLKISDTQIIDGNIKWMASKTDLVELSTALYEGGFVGSDKGKLTKKEFMKNVEKIFSVNLNTPQKTIGKAMLRENPTQFIDKLKIQVLNYNDKNINKIK